MDLRARSDANTGSTAMRAGFELDLAALESWLESNVDGFAGPLTAEQFKGGQSNPTYKLITPAESYVLRSKPTGQLLASAHAIDREFRIISALGGTSVPVPHAYAFCRDESVIGRQFYLMSFTDGPIVWDLPTDRWAVEDRAAIWRAGVDVAANLHSVDPIVHDLGDFGKQGGYVFRQFKRWSEQYRSKTRSAINNPAFDQLMEWLPDRLPSDEPTAIVHGDLQLSNMILQPDGKAVAALIDWELSTLGNPLSDFAYYCRDYYIPAEAGGFQGAVETLGIPPIQEMTARWSATTGYPIDEDWGVYVIFNMYRLAAIRQGVAQRIKDGTATSANANVAAEGAVTMAENAWRLAKEMG